MRMSSGHCLLIALLMSLSTVQASAELLEKQRVSIELRVLDESGDPVESGVLLVNDLQATASGNGQLTARVDSARLYQLLVSAPGFYSMLHSFSEQERRLFDGRFPDVALVRKIPGRVMVAFAGDAMVGRRYHQPNPGDPRLVFTDDRLSDSKALLKVVKPYFDLADYSSINLETPVVAREPAEKSTKGVTFYSYPETLEALSWAGVDHVSLGNNHSFDYLEAALEETLDRLSSSKLGFSGAGSNAAAALLPYRTEIQGVDYSFFGYVGWSGRVKPSQVAEGDDKGGAALGSLDNIVGSLSAEDSGRVSVVEYHGSKEYSFAPTDETRERLRAAIDNGADIAIGHHPHVLHGFEMYKGKLIAYSLGNFMFDQYIYETQRSALLYVWMDGEKFHRAEVVPLYMKTYRPTPAMGLMRDYVLRRLRQQSALEDVAMGLSGGHGVIGGTAQPTMADLLVQEISGGEAQQLISPTNWQHQFEKIAFRRDGVAYRVGRDWWSLGDHEQEQQYQLVDRSWAFSNADSGISSERALEKFAMKIVAPVGESGATVGQQYFTRVWDDNPKSLALDVYAEQDVEVRACLELRTGSMSTEEGRLNPVVRCLDSVSVSAGDWRPLRFNFSPPPREGNRGLRFRFEVFAKAEAVSSGSATVYFDNLKFISWEMSGVSRQGQSVQLSGDKRWNILEISSQSKNKPCCEITQKRF